MKSTLGVAVLMLALSLANSVNEVTFSAALTSHKTLSAGQTVVYDTVSVNEGNAYNPVTGIFTCPKAGRYFFSFNGLTQLGKEFWVELKHNNKLVASAFAHLLTGYAGAGNTVILDLKAGDTVQVQTRRTSHLYGTTGEIYATFSGFSITISTPC